MSNPGLYGFPKATGVAAKVYPRRKIDLVVDYDVHYRGSPSLNTEALNAAFTDVTNLWYNGGPATVIKLPTARDIYEFTTFNMPPAPVTIIGDGQTSSIMGTGLGTLMTYDTANPIPAGIGQTFSYQTGGNTDTRGVAYQGNVWRLKGLGFTNTAGSNGVAANGLYFPKWTAGNAFQQLQLWMEDCTVSNFQGTSGTHAGIYYIISGGIEDSYFHNVTVAGCHARGFYIGSDSRMVNVTAHSNGEEGFYNDSYIWQAIGVKAWDNGKNHTPGKMSGVYINGPPAGNHLTNLYLQDNNGPGMTMHQAGRLSVFGLSIDRNNWNEEASGLLIQDSHHVIIHGYDSTDSKTMARTTVSGPNALNSATINVASTAGFNAGPDTMWIDGTNIAYTAIAGSSFTGCGNHPAYLGTEVCSQKGAQLHALKVTNTGGNTNNNNYIQLVHNPYDVGFLVEAAVDPASDLSGTHVIVGEGHIGSTDSSPASIEFLQAGGSVTVNRKFFPNAAGGIFLGSGATLRIL